MKITIPTIDTNIIDLLPQESINKFNRTKVKWINQLYVQNWWETDIYYAMDDIATIENWIKIPAWFWIVIESEDYALLNFISETSDNINTRVELT